MATRISTVKLALLIFCSCIWCGWATVTTAQSDTWPQTLNRARGQTVYFNAWGGSDGINAYIEWAADQIKKRYGVNLKHVKVTDIGEVVSRILAEKSAGRTQDGSVDLMWINGENFRAMKSNQLLYGPFSHNLPHYQLVDTENKPTVLYDFALAVDHMEAPWGMAQLVFQYDSAVVKTPPRSMVALLKFAAAHPGRVTYPAPPSFYGTTFIKQALLELAAERQALYRPVAEADFAAITAPLWDYLDRLHPHLWRKGRSFTSGAPEMKQLLNDGEIFISLSFNPNDASNAIASGELPDTVRTYIHSGGTIGNTHFVAIPFNARAKAGAMVVANFLLSPLAQARKADPTIWGDPTVLNLAKLAPADRQRFGELPLGVATLAPTELAAVLPEPDASWVEALESTWQKRFSR